jgi:hypothetical protein
MACVARRRTDGRSADCVHQFDGGTGLVDAKASACEYLLVDSCVQIGKSFGEFHLLAINLYRSKSAPGARSYLERKDSGTYGEKPLYACSLKFEKACHALGIGVMNLANSYISKEPQEQIKEMHSYISRYPSGLCRFSFPRHLVPCSASGDVSKAHIVDPPRVLFQLFLQFDESRVKPQLKNRVNSVSELSLELLKRVQIPGVDHQGLLADCIRAHSKSEAAVCVMQIIRRADTQIMNPALVGPAPQFLEVTIESFNLGEKSYVEGILIEQACSIMRVNRSYELVTRVSNRLEVPRRYVTGHPRNREILWHHESPPKSKLRNRSNSTME